MLDAPAFFFPTMKLTTQRLYSVYILWSDRGCRFYIGVTENVDYRVAQHNAGVSKWTKRYAGSWDLVWKREFDSLGEARRFEVKLKRQKGGHGFWGLTGLDPGDFKVSSGS